MDDGNEVEKAVARLLAAARRYSAAYETWAHAPAAWEPLRRDELRSAERAFEGAEREVATRECARRRP